MGQSVDRVDDLIDVDLLEAMFDEWMHTNFHTISASGKKVVCIDKDGTRTETADLTGPKGDPLRWQDMSQADKQALAQLVRDGIVFASVATCESIIDELT